MLRQPATRAARLWLHAASACEAAARAQRRAGCCAAQLAAAATPRLPPGAAPRPLRLAAGQPTRAASQRRASTRAQQGGSGGERTGCGEAEGAAAVTARGAPGSASTVVDEEEHSDAACADANADPLAGWAGGDAAEEKRLTPGLYVVSTPIGNLEDITLRALRVLRTADAVLAEDTRRTRALLTHYGLRTPLVSLHAHNEAARSDGVLSRLAAGDTLALVSDAGTPAVSDPGALLVARAVEAGHAVVAVPGASALLAALVVAGLPTHVVTFAGFLPAPPAARRRRLQALAAASREATLALYMPPHKAAATLADAAAALGGSRRCCVARELTKIHEEAWRGTLAEAAIEFSAAGRARGEFTLLIEGASANAGEGEDSEDGGLDAAAAAAAVEPALRELLAQGVSTSSAAREVALRTGVRRKDVYAAALSLSKPV